MPENRSAEDSHHTGGSGKYKHHVSETVADKPLAREDCACRDDQSRDGGHRSANLAKDSGLLMGMSENLARFHP